LPKLSVARDPLQTYRQTVPHTRPCNNICCGFVEMLVLSSQLSLAIFS